MLADRWRAGCPHRRLTLEDADAAGRRVAYIDQVATQRAYREQGLAHAVLGACLRCARAWGAQRIVLQADAEDWPQIFYVGLGFRSVGELWTFTRRA